jgi:hypothetical protein
MWLTPVEKRMWVAEDVGDDVVDRLVDVARVDEGA